MTTQAAYTEQEWRTLQFAPLWTFEAVAGADRNIDEEETAELVRQLQRATAFRSELVRDVCAPLADDWETMLDRCRADDRGIDGGLAEVADLLDSKVSVTDAILFKEAMLGLGLAVANASGGLFGLGSKVSAVEKKALKRVADALRV